MRVRVDLMVGFLIGRRKCGQPRSFAGDGRLQKRTADH
jgi:hypothetical protein